MGYRLNIRGSSVWENLLKDNNIEISDTNGYFSSGTLDGVLDELYNNSGGGLSWSIVSTNTTATADSGYFVDTSSGVVTIILPLSPTIGDKIVVIDYAGVFASSNCTIARNGNNIMGLAEDFICDIDNLGIEFVYADATEGWKISDTAAGGGGGGGGLVWSIISTNTTATINNGYFVDTSSASVTVTLPLSPTIGHTVGITDYTGTFGTNNCVIARNGHNIMGSADDFACDFDNMSIKFTYVDATEGWRITDTADGQGGSSGGSGITWSVQTASLTAASGNGYMMDNSSGVTTVTLPASPSVSDMVSVADLNGNFEINNCTVARNGNKIQGLEEDVLLNVKNQRITLVYSGATDGWIITELEPNSSQFEYMPYAVMHVQDQKPQGTSGGASVAGWQTRVLNTVVKNDITGASLSSNQITLPAGEYWIEATAPFRATNTVANQYFRLDIQDDVGTTLLRGTNQYSFGNTSYYYGSGVLPLRGIVTLSETTTILARQYNSNAWTEISALGVGVGQGTEVYTDMKITKIGGNYQPKPVITSARYETIPNLITTGHMMGFDISKTGANQVTVTKGTCLDATLETVLSLTSDTPVTIPSVANTIYHIFVVRLISNGLFTVKAYTTEAAVASDTDVNAFRWIGFCLTDGGSSVRNFHQNDDIIEWAVDEAVVIVTNPSTTAFTVDTSVFIPSSRIISYNLWGKSGGVNYFRCYVYDLSDTYQTSQVMQSGNVSYLSYYDGGGAEITKPVVKLQGASGYNTGLVNIPKVRLRR